MAGILAAQGVFYPEFITAKSWSSVRQNPNFSYYTPQKFLMTFF